MMFAVFAAQGDEDFGSVVPTRMAADLAHGHLLKSVEAWAEVGLFSCLFPGFYC
jgi:hypothetical protein